MAFGNWLHNLWNDVTGVTAAREAADAQRAANEAAQGTFSPYTQAGAGAVDQLAALTGGAGADAQAAAFAALEGSPMFQGLVQQGENAMLQNAAATGGLRGGNTQGALAQYRPQMLQSMIQQQVSNLSGLANLGFGGAQGTAGLQTALGDINAAERMAQYDLQRGMVNDIAGGAINLASLFSGGGAGAGAGGIPSAGSPAAGSGGFNSMLTAGSGLF